MPAPVVAHSLAGLKSTSASFAPTTSAPTSTRVPTGIYVAGSLSDTDYVTFRSNQAARTAGSAGMSHRSSNGISANARQISLVNDAGVEVIRAIRPSQSTIKLQYWNGSAYVDIDTVSGIANDTQYRIILKFSGCGSSSDGFVSMTVQTADGGGFGSVSGSGLNFSAVTNVVNVRAYVAYTPTNAIRFGEVYLRDEDGGGGFVYSNLPTSDGTDNTGGTGTYASIDDSTTGYDSDFISLDTSGQKRSFKSAARSLGGRTPRTVAAEFRMRCGATGVTQVKPYLLIAGVRYYHASSPVTLTTSFESYVFCWELDPSTGLGWTEAAASSADLEFGIEVV